MDESHQKHLAYRKVRNTHSLDRLDTSEQITYESHFKSDYNRVSNISDLSDPPVLSMRLIIVILNGCLLAAILRPRRRKVRMVGTSRCDMYSNVWVSDM